MEILVLGVFSVVGIYFGCDTLWGFGLLGWFAGFLGICFCGWAVTRAGVLELVVCTFVLGFSFGGCGCGVSDVDFLVGFVRCHNTVPSGGFWVAANGFFGLCGFRGGYGFGFRFASAVLLRGWWMRLLVSV